MYGQLAPGASRLLRSNNAHALSPWLWRVSIPAWRWEIHLYFVLSWRWRPRGLCIVRMRQSSRVHDTPGWRWQRKRQHFLRVSGVPDEQGGSVSDPCQKRTYRSCEPETARTPHSGKARHRVDSICWTWELSVVGLLLPSIARPGRLATVLARAPTTPTTTRGDYDGTIYWRRTLR